MKEVTVKMSQQVRFVVVQVTLAAGILMLINRCGENPFWV